MRTIPIAATLMLVACAAAPRPDDWLATLPPPPDGFTAPGPLDPLDAAAIWGVGDRVVYTIEVVHGAERNTFTFTLTTRQLPAPGDGLATVHPVHDRILTRTNKGEQWQHGPVVAYEYRGPALMHAELRGDDGTECSGDLHVDALANLYVEDVRVGYESGVHEMFGALLGLDCLHAALLRVVRAPSLLSVLGNFGRIRVGLRWPDGVPLEVTTATTPFGALPTTWCPMTLEANGQPALDGRVQFTWKQSPLLPGAGVLQVEAWHPDDPTARLTIRLAAAQRGVPPDHPDPDDFGKGLRRGMTVDAACALLGGRREKVHERGRLADGRRVELVELDVPTWWLFVVVHDDRLLYACGGDDLARHWLRLRGFTADPAPADGAHRDAPPHR